MILYIFNFVQKGENKIHSPKKYFKKRLSEKYRRKQHLLNYLCISKKYLPDLLSLLNNRVLEGKLRYSYNTIINSNKELYNKYDFKGNKYPIYNLSIVETRINLNVIANYFNYNYYKPLIEIFKKIDYIDFKDLLIRSIECKQIEIAKWIILNKKISYNGKLAGMVNKFICKFELDLPFVADPNDEFEIFKMDIKMFNFAIKNNQVSVTEFLFNFLLCNTNYLIIDYILDNLINEINPLSYSEIYYSLKEQNGRYDSFLPLFHPKILIFNPEFIFFQKLVNFLK